MAAPLNSEAAAHPWRWSLVTAGPVMAVALALAVLPAEPRPAPLAPGPLTSEICPGGGW